MSEKKMQAVLTDVLIAEAYAAEHSLPVDTARKITSHLYSEIFSKYHLTREEYMKNYNFYALHPELFEKTMGPIIDSLTVMEARTPAHIAPAQGATKPQPLLINPHQGHHNKDSIIKKLSPLLKKK